MKQSKPNSTIASTAMNAGLSPLTGLVVGRCLLYFADTQYRIVDALRDHAEAHTLAGVLGAELATRFASGISGEVDLQAASLAVADFVDRLAR